MNLLYGVVVGREAPLDHPQSERAGGGGEEEDCSGQLQEEGRHPLLIV